jgi:hypothetical protein
MSRAAALAPTTSCMRSRLRVARQVQWVGTAKVTTAGREVPMLSNRRRWWLLAGFSLPGLGLESNASLCPTVAQQQACDLSPSASSSPRAYLPT